MTELKYSREDYVNWQYSDFNDFITDSGHLKIQAAFFEGQNASDPNYTLRMREHRGFPSAYQIITNAKSEYDAAMKLCGNWTLWLRWKKSKGLFEGNIKAYKGVGLKDAVEALEARIHGDALTAIIKKSEDGDYRASKDLVTWGIPKVKTGKKVKAVAEKDSDNIFELAAKIKK